MFIIRYQTVRYRPDLAVTIRNNVDGWQEELGGVYENDAWSFRLDSARYVNGVAFKFVLEGQYWMEGGNLFLQPAAGGVYTFGAGQVVFPPIGELLVENGFFQQRFFPPNLDQNHEYDVIVVGSGVGGGILADQLADLGLDVLVLEAGSYLVPSHVGNLPRQHALAPRIDKHIWHLWDDFKVTNYVNGPGSAYQGGQGFNLGGRSVFWGGLIPRMSWWELETWPQEVRWYLEDHGYALAEELLKRTQLDSDYQRQVRSELTRSFPDYVVMGAPMAVQHSLPQLNTIPAGIFSTADLLLESRLTGGPSGNQNLTINLNHAAVQLLTEGGRATGVLAHDLIADTPRSYRGRAVVLAAGTVESAKLALLSGLNDPSGTLGAGITDHPIFFTHFALPAGAPLHRVDAAAKLLLQHRDARVEAGPPRAYHHRYNMVLELGADFNQGRFVDPELLAAAVAARNGLMLCELVFLFDAPLVAGNGLAQPGPSFVKPVVNMQEPPITPAEWAEINALRAAVLGQLGAIPLPGGNLDLVRAPMGGVAHEVGTLRMGEQGVLDANLKFRAYQNLYACDLSVFPSSPAANPTLTLAALALRLATHLRGTL